MASKFSVVVFAETQNKRSEPFIATRDPEVVRMVRKMITDRLKTNPPAAETRTSKPSQELK